MWKRSSDKGGGTQATAATSPAVGVAHPCPLIHSPHRPARAMLAACQRIPAVYEQREFALAGGLMSYGTNLTDTRVCLLLDQSGQRCLHTKRRLPGLSLPVADVHANRQDCGNTK